MLRIIVPAVAIGLLSASGASAATVNDKHAKRIACYKQVMVPATYSVKKVKIKDSYRQYVKRTNGRIDLMEYPPVYREEKTVKEEAHIVMRQIVCDD